MLRPALLLAAALPAFAQTPLTRANVSNILGFEDSQNGRLSAPWNAGANPAIVADAAVFQAGRYSARVTHSAAEGFTGFAAALPQDFAGTTVELRGFLRRQDVTGFTAFYVRQDGPGSTLAFASLQARNLNGTAEWEEFSVAIRLQPLGRQITWGFFVAQPGTAWVDSLQLLVDGQPIAAAPAQAPSVLVTDREFDAGSQVSVAELSERQVANLAVLGKVWGFVKYHHPAIASGQRHWDYDLFRVLPGVLNAPTSAAAQDVMLAWVQALGPVPPCANCATLAEANRYLAPDNDWLRDTVALGAALSDALVEIHRHRPRGGGFYAGRATNGNPAFSNELNYPALRHPDAGYQLLGLFRLWNMMQYYNPNRDTMADDPAQASAYWNDTLAEFIRPFALAPDRRAYQQAFLRLIARINDTHAGLWSGLDARPPLGACFLPVDVRFVENVPVVFRKTLRDPAAASPFEIGDVITHIDGAAVAGLIEEWSPFYAASNQPTRLRDIGASLGRGACGPATITIERAGASRELTATRHPLAAVNRSRTLVHDLDGPAFQMLADDVAYLKLSDFRMAQAADYIRRAAGAQGLIIDIRNYPSEFAVFALGQHLMAEPSSFVKFTQTDLDNPGAFFFRNGPTIVPAAPRYAGKIVILIDEVSQSQAEYTTMALRTAPGAIVIGSTTAGADGDVSLMPLPGGQHSYISGLGIFYPDGRPTQRIGILPNVELRPTLAGIREGRDELIEEAIRRIRE